jgi:hypothetical protein
LGYIEQNDYRNGERFSPSFGHSSREHIRNMRVRTCGSKAKKILLSLLVVSLVATGCGSYASQSEKNLAKASSDVAGATYVLEEFGNGEISGPYSVSGLQEYAKSMQKTEKTLQSLQPPSADKQEHEQAVEALSQAQRLVQEAGQEGVSRQEAPELARRLGGYGEELET